MDFFLSEISEKIHNSTFHVKIHVEINFFCQNWSLENSNFFATTTYVMPNLETSVMFIFFVMLD